MPIDNCPNCGSEVTGPYCGQCGQPGRSIRRPISHFTREIVNEYFGLDGKFLRSIVPLIFRPGKLTVEYLSGRVQHYVRPLRLYLTTSLVFFFLVAVLDPVSSLDRAFSDRDDTWRIQPPDEIGEASRALIELDSLRAVVVETQRALVAKAAAEQTVPGDTAEHDVMNPGSTPTDSADVGKGNLNVTVDLPASSLWNARKDRIAAMSDVERKQLLLGTVSRFFRNLPKLMFVMLPVFALLLKLVYIRRKRFYGEHVVFTLHVHAFVFVIFTLIGLLTFAPDSGWTTAASAILAFSMPLYIFLAQKHVYAQGWIKTAIKFVFLGAVYAFGLVTLFSFAAFMLFVLGA